MILKETIYRNP